MNNTGDLPRPKGPAQYICFDADLTRQIGKYWAHLLNILFSANEPSTEWFCPLNTGLICWKQSNNYLAHLSARYRRFANWPTQILNTHPPHITHTDTRTHTRTRAHTHTRTHTRTRTHTHTHTHTHTDTRTHTWLKFWTHTRTRTYTHTHTHTHETPQVSPDGVIGQSVCCSMVQCGAVWCSVLQCVAVCCSLPTSW